VYGCKISKRLSYPLLELFNIAAMKLSGFVSLLLVCVVGVICAEHQWPLHNDGINSVVEWYAFIRGEFLLRV
jgi:hypothetical protein